MRAFTRQVGLVLGIGVLVAVCSGSALAGQPNSPTHKGRPITVTARGTTSLSGRPAAPFAPLGQKGSQVRQGFEPEGNPIPAFPVSIFPPSPLPAPKITSSLVAGSNPEVGLSFTGLNAVDQRNANNGNQFSLEPPDQGLCVGGIGSSNVVEVVNTVIRVYDKADGSPLSDVEDLNTFFGYAPQYDRANQTLGPFITDPSCYYDPESHRFVVAVVTLDQDPEDGSFTGTVHLDLAVSETADPAGSWTLYSVPIQDDGTDGTPTHDDCPCIGDYPHIGADANGIYVTTNEYSLFGSGYNGAQLYAFAKDDLYSVALGGVTFENLMVGSSPAFTVWPATSNAGDYYTNDNGVEFFLSTIAGDGSETGNPTGTANKIVLWALSNTQNLGYEELNLDNFVLDTETYVLPPQADQKPGAFPLGQCLNDTKKPIPTGTKGCWQLVNNFKAVPKEKEVSPDASDTRIQQVWFADGILYAAASTGVKFNKGGGNKAKAGIAWFEILPYFGEDTIDGDVLAQGYLGLKDANLTYPAFAVGPDGTGVMAFTVMGKDYFPSAGYAMFTAPRIFAPTPHTAAPSSPFGPIHIAAAGAGPDDGFSGYGSLAFPQFPRWGDYGAAVTDGSDIWIASEWIDQTCTLDTFYQSFFVAPAGGDCGGTRDTFSNWSTRITMIPAGPA